jgi:uncharacterized protein (DUF697 family)
MKIPFDEILGIVSDQKKTRDYSSGDVRVSIMVLAGTSPALIEATRTGLYPLSGGGRIHVVGVPRGSDRVSINSLSDVALVLMGDDSDEACALRIWQDCASIDVPCALVGDFSSAQIASACFARLASGGVAERDILAELGADDAVNGAGAWMIKVLPDEAAQAAAVNFSVCRHAQAESLVRQACKENALASLLGLLPTTGADIVVMTASQVSLSLRLASLFGQDLSVERAREVIPVLLAGPAWRGLARMLIKRTPIPAVVVRAGVGAAGTYAIGEALVVYFESKLAVDDLETLVAENGRSDSTVASAEEGSR